MKKSIPQFFAKVAVLGVLFAAVFAPAAMKADSIVGSISITGNDTFDSGSITFTNPGYVTSTNLTGISSLSSTPPTLEFATLTNLTYSSLTGQLFTTTNPLTGSTASLTINSASAIYIPASAGVNKKVTIDGLGMLSLTGYDPTLASFSLTSSTVGSTTSFQLVVDSPANVTPEPNSLLLLGTGLVGAAGVLMRRRRSPADSLTTAA